MLPAAIYVCLLYLALGEGGWCVKYFKCFKKLPQQHYNGSFKTVFSNHRITGSSH